MGYWRILSFFNIVCVVPSIAYFFISLFEFIGFSIASVATVSGNYSFSNEFCTAILADSFNSDI